MRASNSTSKPAQRLTSANLGEQDETCRHGGSAFPGPAAAQGQPPFFPPDEKPVEKVKWEKRRTFHLPSSSTNRRVSSSNLTLHQEIGPPQVPLLGLLGKLLHVSVSMVRMRREDILITTAPWRRPPSQCSPWSFGSSSGTRPLLAMAYIQLKYYFNRSNIWICEVYQ